MTRRPPEPQNGLEGVVVLAGGTSRRMGGGDKTALDVGGAPILHRLLTELPPWPTVVVAPRAAAPLPAGLEHVRWTREDPAGGGPAAGLAAGVAALPPEVTFVVALAGDQPFAAGAVPRLLKAIREDVHAEAVLTVDAGGRTQPLLAVYRASALRRVLPHVRSGDSIRSAFAGISTSLIPVGLKEGLDVDDSADLALAREIVHVRDIRPVDDQSS